MDTGLEYDLGQHFGPPTQLSLLKPQKVHKRKKQYSVLPLEVWLGCCRTRTRPCLSITKVAVKSHPVLAYRSCMPIGHCSIALLMLYLPTQGKLTFIPDVADHFLVVDRIAVCYVPNFRPRQHCTISCGDKLLPSLTILPPTDRVYAC